MTAVGGQPIPAGASTMTAVGGQPVPAGGWYFYSLKAISIDLSSVLMYVYILASTMTAVGGQPIPAGASTMTAVGGQPIPAGGWYFYSLKCNKYRFALQC
ncbi:hypothetical protein KIN20_020906 [Parelaphostrongylus tenuis]|uniref:Uncharacterized protein n=1 Tax=Parelaphostrongylus tenuis TaxID=148309 RepID=A0AAD5QU32_PARTN|nr:hypothetical protein KIN20_020906 [Parelaphostrongylus tenuis]